MLTREQDTNGPGAVVYDQTSALTGTSFTEFEENCATGGFVDVIAEYPGSDSNGNWCLSAIVEKRP
ncbi:MAG: hypothetical protein AAGA54_00650 [Myxococcota bacterium]